MKERIEALEKENKEKDSTINKLKAENGRLRAKNNVLEGKVNLYKNEESKERRSYNNSNSRTPNYSYNSGGMDFNKIVSGEFTKEHNFFNFSV